MFAVLLRGVLCFLSLEGCAMLFFLPLAGEGCAMLCFLREWGVCGCVCCASYPERGAWCC